MKKILILILAVALALVCTACANNDQGEKAEKAAETKLCKYTVYNRTGETVTALTLTDSKTSETTAFGSMENGASMEISMNAAVDSEGAPNLSLSFTTENMQFTAALLQTETPVTLLAESAEGGPISFTAPES